MSPDKPEERRRIDLDAARRARDEKKGEPPVVVFGGEEYELPRELPAEAVHAFGQLVAGDPSGLVAGIEALFGEAWTNLQAAAKAAGRALSFDDEIFLLEAALQEYGFDLPESPASGASSANTGTLSRPTSPASTRST